MTSHRKAHECFDEADRLIAEGRWTEADFRRLCAELYEIGSYPGSSMLARARPEWIYVDPAVIEAEFGPIP